MSTTFRHPSGLNERVVAKVVVRRGRLHAFETIAPKRTALVVIDLDVATVSEDAICRAMVPRINQLAHALRAAGGWVAWVLPKFIANDHTRAIYGDAAAERYQAVASGDRNDLWPELEAKDMDIYASKTGASAFFPGKCNLVEKLGVCGIDTLLMAGTVTNVCVESSARDAVELGYRVTLVSDACAGHADGQHEATLNTFYRNFGDVRTVDDAIELLNRVRQQQ